MNIIDKLRNLFFTRAPVSQFTDSVLGTLEYDSGSEGWCKTINVEGKSVCVIIDGDWEGARIEEIVPTAHLIIWAREIAENPHDFYQTLTGFFRRELEVNSLVSGYKEEIANLQIENIYLGPYTKEGSAVVNLAGGKDGRHWRCDYEAKKPKVLGYDS